MIVLDRNLNGGTQTVHRFENGYDTEVTDDVLRYLSEDEVVEILEQIENLNGE